MKSNPPGMPNRYDLPLFFLEQNDPDSVWEDPKLSDGRWQMCTTAQMKEVVHSEWLKRIGVENILHRKKWDYTIILETLNKLGMIEEGRSAIGFGVGTEPLPSYFASRGVSVLATDLPAGDEFRDEWVAAGSFSSRVSDLWHPKVCNKEVFESLVTHRPCDMRNLPTDLPNVDFVWSTSALEHIGSHGQCVDFIIESSKLLKPGGTAVHTTEINLSSNGKTVEEPSFYLWTKRSIEDLRNSLRDLGYKLPELNFYPGTDSMDTIVNNVFKLGPVIKRFKRKTVYTSISIIIKKRKEHFLKTHRT